MNKKNEIKEICEEILEKDSYKKSEMSLLIKVIEEVENDNSDEDNSKIRELGNKLKKAGFTGPETNPKKIVRELLDALLFFV